jgi:enoyl-CoA hydratase/carnithine racemase
MAAVNSVLNVTKVSPAYWRATFNNPPLNLFDPETFAALRLLMDDLEQDNDVRVIVFDSANPDFFIAHYDMVRGKEQINILGAAPISEFPNFVFRLVNSHVVSIAAIRGCARGIGSEFALACDMRFASREKSLFGQPEVGAGVIPGAGGLEWLPRLVGRSRALEIALLSDDFDATTAEQYGWINRAVPDAQLEQFVDNYARRVAGFGKFPLQNVKRIINKRSGVPSPAEITECQQVFQECLQQPQTQSRLKNLFAAGLQKAGEFDRNLGRRLGNISSL